MPRFFVPSANFDGDTVRITGDDARHIARALRMAVGETVTVCDMHGTTHTCVLEKITDDGSTARIVESVPSDTEPPCPITLYQAFPKGDKMGCDRTEGGGVRCMRDRSVPVGALRVAPG